MITVRTSTIGDLDAVLRKELTPGHGQAVELADLGLVVLRVEDILSRLKDIPALTEDIRALADQLAEEEMLEHMVNYRKDATGVDNTIFISPKGRILHAARIKVAINPPHTLSPTGEQASVTIHDANPVAGADIPSHVLKQVRQFIELNRGTLMDYWNEKIDGKQLTERLKPIP